MAYIKTVWQDSPSTSTPINAENLNNIEEGIEDLDTRLTGVEEAGIVESFNGRTGTVTPTDGDYSAEQITYDNTTVKDVIDELASDVTNIDTFSASGESFTLTPTSEGNVLAHSIYGMSVQDGTPTPSSPVDIESSVANYKCVGKNLHDISGQLPRTNATTTSVYNGNGLFTINGTADVAAAQLNAITNGYSISGLKVGDSLVLSYEVISGSATSLGSSSAYSSVYIYRSSGNLPIVFPSSLSVGDKAELKIDMTAALLDGDTFTYNGIQIWMQKNAVFNNLQLAVMIRRYGTDDVFMPYQKTDITTDLTLRAIEVTSSDNYNLVRDGKYYIADSVDWSEDDGYVLTRRIAHEQLSNCIYYNAKENGVQINASINSLANATNLNLFKSNRFIFGTVSMGRGYIASTQNQFAMLIAGSDITDIATGATWLTNNPVIVDYVFATPIIMPLTAEQAEALLSLKTYDTATSIICTADVAPTMEIEYAKERVPALALSGHNESALSVDWASENILGAKNLLPYPYKETTHTDMGITWTDNRDGTVSATGTISSPTGTSRFECVYREPHKLKAGRYILSGCPAGGSETTYYMWVAFWDGTSNIGGTFTFGEEVEFTVEEAWENYQIMVGCYFRNGYAISGTMTFKPMVRPASVKDSTYVPYAMTNKELTDNFKCNQTTAGTYTLQAVVDANGVVTYSWV